MFLFRHIKVTTRNARSRSCVSVMKYSHCSNKKDEHKKNTAEKIAIIGLPFSQGQPREGVHKGPEAIRKLGLLDTIKAIKTVKDVKDVGDICNKFPTKKLTVEERYKLVAQCNKEFSAKICEVLSEGRMVVNLGGDHSVGVGSIHGHCQAKGEGNVCVLWVDAHADINTIRTSDTGNAHGMPLGFLVKEVRCDKKGPTDVPEWEWCKPCLTANDLGYIALRSVDDYERYFIDKYHINAYDMYRVDRLGVYVAIKEVLNRIDPEKRKSIHVSFDIDALDPSEAPTTGTPVRGGLTLREGVIIMEELYKTGRVGVVDLVEVNPTLGNEKEAKITAFAGAQLIETVCGGIRRGTKPKDA